MDLTTILAMPQKRGGGKAPRPQLSVKKPKIELQQDAFFLLDDGKKIGFRKEVLAKHSVYAANLFGPNWCEAGTDEFPLRDVSFHAASALVAAVYMKERQKKYDLNLRMKTVPETVKLCEDFGQLDLADHALAFFRKNMSRQSIESVRGMLENFKKAYRARDMVVVFSDKYAGGLLHSLVGRLRMFPDAVQADVWREVYGD